MIPGSGMVITLVKLCAAALPACVVYAALAWLLKVSEFKAALGFLKKTNNET